jgi:hypothetical protein
MNTFPRDININNDNLVIYTDSSLGIKIRNIDKIIHRWIDTEICNLSISDNNSHIIHQNNLIDFFDKNYDKICNIFDVNTLICILRGCYFKFFHYILINNDRFNINKTILKKNSNKFLEIIFNILQYVNICNNKLQIPKDEYESIIFIINYFKENGNFNNLKNKFKLYNDLIKNNYNYIIEESNWTFWNNNIDKRNFYHFINFNNNIKFYNGFWEYHPYYVNQDKFFNEYNIKNCINEINIIISLFE